MNGSVVAVSLSGTHTFSKPNQNHIRLIEGIGVEGDAHAGTTVKHRSRVAKDPTQPNLRQVHLVHAELHDDLAEKGYDVAPGQMGENVTTRGVDLLHLPTGAQLHFGDDAIVEVTGLRNPCRQLEGIKEGLMAETIGKDDDGEPTPLSGVMSIVIAGGDIKPGDSIRVELPQGESTPLVKV